MCVFRPVFALVLAFSLWSAPQVQAQNWRLEPTFGAVSLRSGFVPDPHTRRVIAGGDNHFLGSEDCRFGGWFASPPDYRLIYEAGRYPTLTIYVDAPGDTMLLVNDPHSRWYCNDDYSERNPLIRFANPPSGQYDIWVGTYNRANVRNAVIFISER